MTDAEYDDAITAVAHEYRIKLADLWAEYQRKQYEAERWHIKSMDSLHKQWLATKHPVAEQN